MNKEGDLHIKMSSMLSEVCVFAQPLASVGCPAAEWKGAEQ